MVKINKKLITMIGILLFSFLMTEMTFAEEEAIDDSSLVIETKMTASEEVATGEPSSIIEAMGSIQNAMRNGEYEKTWNQWTKLSQRYDSLKKFKKIMTENPKMSQDFYNARLGKVEPITSKRVWITATSSSSPPIPGFYLVKEDGEWKLATLRHYINEANISLSSLAKAIRAYYNDNKKLPNKLSQLTEPVAYIKVVPQDPFSDEGKPYIYGISDNGFVLYSLGPDSDDDSGAKQHYLENGFISNGDLIIKGKVTKKSKEE